MIAVKNLEFSYSRGANILKNVEFDAKKGECIAVLGNNGAGKSTLIKCLNKILKPQSGVVTVDGIDIQSLKQYDIAKHMAYVAQKNDGYKFTVYDAVLLGRKPYIKFSPTEEDYKITEEIINRMGLSSFKLRYIDELSGGELQKVMIARALAQQPKVLLLDEPTSNLDLRNQYEVLKTVREIAKEDNISVIIIIHDLNLALRYCDRFLFVKDSSVYAYGGIEVMNSHNISSVYGMNVAVNSVQGINIVIPLIG